MTNKARKTVKVEYWTQVINGGDGSAYERKYKTQREMKEDEAREREHGECFCESTGYDSFEVDVETGEIVTDSFFYQPDPDEDL
jgi:hypothetical protein